MNYTELQKARANLIAAQESIEQAEKDAIKEKGDNFAWQTIKQELGI